MSNRRQMFSMLENNGWKFVGQNKHVNWQCPCQKHFIGFHSSKDIQVLDAKRNEMHKCDCHFQDVQKVGNEMSWFHDDQTTYHVTGRLRNGQPFKRIVTNNWSYANGINICDGTKWIVREKSHLTPCPNNRSTADHIKRKVLIQS